MLEQLKTILGKVLPTVDMSEVTGQTRLMEDLGFDSLALMMLAALAIAGRDLVVGMRANRASAAEGGA